MFNGEGLIKEEAADDSPSTTSTQSSVTESSDSDTSPSSEWDLSRPSDILCVFLLLRNLDDWMATSFKARVERGVRGLARSISKDGEAYRPWRHDDTALRPKQAKKEQVKKERERRPLRDSSFSNIGPSKIKAQGSAVSSTTVTTTTTQSSLSLYR